MTRRDAKAQAARAWLHRHGFTAARREVRTWGCVVHVAEGVL